MGSTPGVSAESTASRSLRKKGAKNQMMMSWVKEVKEEVASLASIQRLEAMEFLKTIKKLDRKCTREMRRLKTEKKAKRLLTVVTTFLRSLKMMAVDIEENRPKIYASFGLILTHLVAVAGKLREPTSEAENLYEYMKRLLDGNQNWIFITILAFINPSALKATSPLQHSLLKLALNDPTMVSTKETVIQKAVCAAGVLLKLEERNQGRNPKLSICDGWQKEDLATRSRHSDLPAVIQVCKRKLKIKIPASELRIASEFGTSSMGIGWSLTTAPSELPQDFPLTDSEAEEDNAGDNDKNSDREDNEVNIPSKRFKTDRSNKDVE